MYEGDLRAYFKIIFERAKNLSNPYHNFRHMFHVLYLCYKGGIYYRASISRQEFRALLIAAMFHDFNHPGRTGNDDLNIEIAIRGLRSHILEEDRPLLPMIEAWISGTEFPYKNSGEELPLCAKILRDADGSQAFSVAWIQQIIFGLAGEMGITPVKVLEMQRQFLAGIRFLTEWAKIEFPDEVVQAKVREAEDMLLCLA